MKLIGVIISIAILCFSFVFYLLSLMKLAPLVIAAPLLLLSLFITIMLLNSFNRFRGFK
ncbi:hypothetical protein LZP85_02450 [Priestia flexa]|uniref:Uncharacterized protein n=1 Tax=Priestia flexa TaxID=86664 RepID=A0A1N6YDH0_9BACI|nr:MULTISPECIES: hypothetical protein [Bacillaceae]MBN8251139.1 hypothetical protein [Priestia flexa]MBN8433343.1 hypothetical protein [Priestia flexa]MBY6086606.1 hypothetical protein [Priestia flexa]MCA0965869.1 hypothetical protein [Priestia flexa]MCA1203448.1 hypothetical protein [Priestia flexa]